MEDNRRIDFSSIDPSRDGERWSGMISSLVDSAMEAREEDGEGDVPGMSVMNQAFTWARPMLAIAALFAITIWGVFFFLGSNDPVESGVTEEEPAYMLAGWAAAEETPRASEILNVLGGYHELP